MNKIIQFLEENHKWVVRILVVVGIGLIVKLWWFGLQVRGTGSGGYIDLSIGRRFDYYWISAGYISVSLLFLSILLIIKINITKNKIRKIQIAFLILLLGMVGKSIFFLVSPDFAFYLTPVTSQYKDKDGNVTDIDKYLESIGKYCLPYPNNSLNYMDTKDGMCSKYDKFQTFFYSVEDYIKVFEYAKNNNLKLLYDRTYGGANKFGIEKIIEKYDDETFQAYVIGYENNIEILQLILSKSSNGDLKKILTNEIEKIKFYFENESKYNQNEGYNFWDDLYKSSRDELRTISSVNEEIITKYY